MSAQDQRSARVEIPFLSSVKACSCALAVLGALLFSPRAHAQEYLQVYSLGVGFTDTLLVPSDLGWVDPYYGTLGASYGCDVDNPWLDALTTPNWLYGAPGGLYGDWWWLAPY